MKVKIHGLINCVPCNLASHIFSLLLKSAEGRTTAFVATCSFTFLLCVLIANILQLLMQELKRRVITQYLCHLNMNIAYLRSLHSFHR